MLTSKLLDCELCRGDNKTPSGRPYRAELKAINTSKKKVNIVKENKAIFFKNPLTSN